MANKTWLGGATAVAQVSTITLNNDTDDAETALTVTMTAEDGSTQQESITPSGTDESTIAAALQAELDSSTQTLFQAVTWTQASNVVTGTAKTAGVPFYFSSAYTGGTGTTTDATGTANAGPNDWATAANWSGGTVPSGSDAIFFVEGAHDLLYGLDQSGTTYGNFHVGKNYTGTLGDPNDGTPYYLQLDLGSAECFINGRGNGVFIDFSGAGDVYVLGSKALDDAVQLKSSGISALYIAEPEVLGTVTLADSFQIANLYVLNCPNAKIDVGESITCSGSVNVNAGAVTFESPGGAITHRITGGTVIYKEDDLGSMSLEVWGGSVDIRSGGTLSSLKTYGGTTDVGSLETAALTITEAVVYGGEVTERGGVGGVTYSNDVVVHAGSFKSDAGRTVAV